MIALRLKQVIAVFFIGCAVLAGIMCYQLRHHSWSAIVGKTIMSARVLRILAKNNHSPLTDKVTKKQLFADYLSAEKKWLLTNPADQQESLTSNFLGHQITCFSYNELIHLLREVFIYEEYGIHLDAPKPTIIDCGSNIGVSILYFKTAYPNAHVVGFEADPINFSLLQRNISTNNLTNVTLVNKAVCDQETVLRFNRCSSTWGKLDENGSVAIEGTRLSGYISQPIDLLKMDIEGAETAVIRDLAATKKLALVKNLVFEFHHTIDDTNGLAEILTTLEMHGFCYQLKTGLEGPEPFDKTTNQGSTGRSLMIYAYQLDAHGNTTKNI